MATLTPKELQKKLDNFGKELAIIYTKSAFETGLYIQTLLDRRIFNEGLDTKLQKIGSYSTNPTLIGRSSFPIKSYNPLKNKGGRRKLEWVTLGSGSSARRLAVLEGGYAKIRELSGGLQTSFVDLSFTGKLQQSIKVVQRKDSAVVLIRGDLQILKAKGNEDRFNTEIFGLAKRERKQALNRVRDNVNKALKKFFK